MNKKISSLFEVLCAGGATIFFMAIWFLFKSTSYYSPNTAYVGVYVMASFLAFTIYQPHFLFSYFVNYSKGLNFIRKHYVTFLIIPIILLSFIALTLVDIFFYSFIPLYIIQVSLSVALIMISWHFACQSVNTIFYHSRKLEQTTLNLIAFRALFFLTFIFGIFSCAVENGSYPFYYLPTISIKLDYNYLMTMRICFLVIHLICLNLIRTSISLLSILSWSSFLLWTLSVTFTKHFFYIVPLLHGIEVIPFYLRSRNSGIFKKVTMWQVVATSLLIFAAILQFAASMEKKVGLSPNVYSRIFIVTLICVNIHHVLSERFTWRSQDSIK